jgi:hypothetical protein
MVVVKNSHCSIYNTDISVYTISILTVHQEWGTVAQDSGDDQILKMYVALLIENPSYDLPPRRFESYEGGGGGIRGCWRL